MEWLHFKIYYLNYIHAVPLLIAFSLVRLIIYLTRLWLRNGQNLQSEPSSRGKVQSTDLLVWGWDFDTCSEVWPLHPQRLAGELKNISKILSETILLCGNFPIFHLLNNWVKSYHKTIYVINNKYIPLLVVTSFFVCQGFFNSSKFHYLGKRTYERYW